MGTTCLHSVQDLTGRGLFTLLDRPPLLSKTRTDMFDDMGASASRLPLPSTMFKIRIAARRRDRQSDMPRLRPCSTVTAPG